MRALSPMEIEGLVDLSGPDGLVDEDDPIEEAWNACVGRGLATYRENASGRFWDINDLGRLALRVHLAVTSHAG